MASIIYWAVTLSGVAVLSAIPFRLVDIIERKR